MEKFAKSILNYFAAFTETRFNFGKKIDYTWSDDQFTTDLCVFPDFQKQLLNSIKSGTTVNITIDKNEYCIKLDSDKFKERLLNLIDENFNSEYISRIVEENNIGMENTNLNIILRKYNLEFRKSVGSIILEIQNEKINELKNIYGFDNIPQTTFNPNIIEQELFDNLQQLAGKSNNPDDFLQKIKIHIQEKCFELIMYDLFASFKKIVPIIGLGSLYLFFHQICKTDENEKEATIKYPLFLIEVEIQELQNQIVLKSIRDIVIINVPAINTFGFENILTTPRASRFVDANYYLIQVEKFLQNNYNHFNNFLLEPFFNPLTAHNKPEVKYRIGLQIIQKENRKLLDYSELITHIDAGFGNKFKDFVKNYISANVYNTTDEVDKIYREKYPEKSVSSVISEIPLPLNKPQKRILTALENEKNKIIVVDGPPGTGKSYTITAIIYWANQTGKSIVITSHKKAALDVIERMLTDKFKDLHPKSKPSILRLDEVDSGINSIQNTLSNPVIAAANNRVNQYNEDAVENDKRKLSEKISEKYSGFLKYSAGYVEYIKKLLEFELIEKNLRELNILEDDVIEIPENFIIDWSNIKKILELIVNAKIEQVSYEQLLILVNYKSSLQSIINAGNEVKELAIDKDILVQLFDFKKNVLVDFTEIIKCIYDFLKPDSLIFPENYSIKFKLFKKFNLLSNKNKELFESRLIQLKSLKYSDLISNLSMVFKKEKSQLSIKDLYNGISILKEISRYLELNKIILPLKKELNFMNNPHSDFISFISKFANIIHNVDLSTVEEIERLYSNFKSVFDKVGVNLDNLNTFNKLFGKSEISIRKYIELLIYLNNNKICRTFDQTILSDYYSCIHKKTEIINDNRLKNLNNFTGDIERIKLSVQKGKRLKSNELKVLLRNVSCIISEPDIISKYFPMEEDSIDILVIDEASQVSIAESISLILRAKQIVIFGDELQYGAVSAFNVNQKYSTEYFKEILNEYSEDYKVNIPPETVTEISSVVSGEINEEDAVIEPIYKPQDGTVEWLKTFSIRTSTLNFAKAIKNYGTSLDVHFRSYPEIINYSNEFFYEPNQIPLVINRIRTKPIKDVLRFIKVETKGNSGNNINIDEIETIKDDIQKLVKSNFKGTIGIITSFREQKNKTEELLHKELPNYHKLKRDNKLTVWFVGDVQGEERDIVYYSFVEDNKFGNADLGTIYPVIGGKADTIRSLKMQRLNVGFSRAKDTMVFVHSMPIEEYHKTRLGDALKFYKNLCDSTVDNYISDENLFGSPAEKDLYSIITQTDFYKKNSNKIKIIAQFPIGKYIKETYNRYIPKYRVDFLLTLSSDGKEKSLILEYDGVEYHTKDPKVVNEHNFSQEYLDYDIERQLELESYGYKFLRLNKFMLKPKSKTETKIDILNNLLIQSFNA